MIETRPASFSSRSISGICLLLSGFILTACSDGDSAIDDPNSSGFAMPQALQRATFPANGSVSAFITIDDESPQAMKISDGSASFSKKLSDGEHDFQIDIVYEPTGSSSIPLVSASKSITVGGSGGNSVSFVESDYVYADTDQDSYTNVREIEADSDYDDDNSVPSDNDDNYEENDQFDFAYDVSGMEGVNFDKSLSTGQGYVTLDDPYDIYKIKLPSSRGTLEAEFVVTNGIFGGLLYLDSNNNAVPGEAQEVDSGDANLRKFLWRFSNPDPNRNYYLLIGPGPEDTETPVAGGYFMRWFTTE